MEAEVIPGFVPQKQFAQCPCLLRDLFSHQHPQQLSLTAKSLLCAQAALPHQVQFHHGAVAGPQFATMDERSTKSGLSTEELFSQL